MWPPNEVVVVNRDGVNSDEVRTCHEAVVMALNTQLNDSWLRSNVGWHEMAQEIKYVLDVAQNNKHRHNQSRGHWNVIVGRDFAASVTHCGVVQMNVRGVNIFVFYA